MAESSSDRARVLKLLEETGRTSTYSEFRQVYEKFKDHPDAVAALRKGVERQSKTVDSGSYCENASYDYKDWWNKNGFFNDLDLQSDHVFLNEFNPAALKRPTARKQEDVLERLLDVVERLTERVEALEQRKPPLPSSGKYRI